MIIIIIPYLKSIGITSLDYLIISHGDLDHIGDALNLIEKFRVKNLILNKYKLTNFENYSIESSKKNNTKVSILESGDIIRISNVVIKFLNPIDDVNENENSLVFSINIDGHKILFTGDVGITQEEKMLNTYDIGKIDILKVGHHGSKYSTSKELLNTLSPDYALISAGINNKFNHPTKETLEGLEAKKVKIYRTDLQCMIEVIFKNHKINFNPFCSAK
ncbi:MAG: ComEC/Rec2 family competence protein [Bacilli bacterium]